MIARNSSGIIPLPDVDTTKVRFTFHVPTFVDGKEAKSEAHRALDSLLNSPSISRWKQDGYTNDGPFRRFSISRTPKPWLLMAEYDEGRHWYVIGYIETTTDLDLPEWEPVR